MKFTSVLITLLFFVSCGESGFKEDLGNSGQEDSVQITDYPQTFTSHEKIAGFYKNKISDQQVLIKVEIKKVLSDDNDGSRHQRFVVSLDNEITLLVAHNIDLAPRVPDITEGQVVIVYGEYEWNNKGGVIHWTHHDPKNFHPHGFVEYAGKRYE